MTKNQQKLEEIAESTAVWIGSIPSLIAHTIFFVAMFALYFFGVTLSNILLIATTVVSFEAIYLNIFVQITINKHSEHLEKHSEHLSNLLNK